MLEATRRVALRRADADSAEEFLKREQIEPELLDAALMPYLVGYDLWRIQPGDTYYSIAKKFSTDPGAVSAANPNLRPELLPIGKLIVVPKDFDLVPDDVPMTWELLRYTIHGLTARYPQLRENVIGTTAYGRSVIQLRLGDGDRAVYYNASHHANEWITTPLVMMILENILKAQRRGESILGVNIGQLLKEVTLFLVPMVNPDGVDLVTGGLNEREYEQAEKIAVDYPEIPFPDGWKANLRGVDLNLNYPARWDEARTIKYELGFDSPAPRDFVGLTPLSERESQAMFNTTEEISPELVIAWHTQGKEIYWKFLDMEPAGAEALGQQMADASGYSLEDVPYASSFAGYKDWFIQDFDRPGYTIEAGEGENPLPLSQLGQMYQDNLPIFLLGMMAGASETLKPAQEERAMAGNQLVPESAGQRINREIPMPSFPVHPQNNVYMTGVRNEKGEWG